MSTIKTLYDLRNNSNLRQKLLKAECQSFANVKCKPHSVLMNELRIKINKKNKKLGFF